MSTPITADLATAVQAARLAFRALLDRPWAFGDSPSINSPLPPDPPAVPDPPAAAAAPIVPTGFRAMAARFPGRCTVCAGYFRAGTPIHFRKGDGARHVGCGAVAQPAQLPAAAEVDPPAVPIVAPVPAATVPTMPVPAARMPRKARSAGKAAPRPAGPLAPIAWADDAF